MNESINALKKIYKPYRYTIVNSCTLFESTKGNIIVKKKSNSNIRDLYNYLESRNFHNFPKLIEDNRSDINVFEYVENISISDR